VYLDVAPKEERSVKDVTNAGPPPPARNFSRIEPPPHHPERAPDREESKPREWDPRGAESPSSDLAEIKRGDPRAATAVHHPLVARAAKEDGQQHRRASPVARIRAALTRRGHRQCRSAPPEKQPRDPCRHRPLQVAPAFRWSPLAAARGRRVSVARVFIAARVALERSNAGAERSVSTLDKCNYRTKI
jgi:hypothetical protein